MSRTAYVAALALAALLVLPATGEAMPGKGNKFDQMDTDKNGKVSQEEFKKFFPEMREGAFITIDKDKSKTIERAEWDEFIVGHAAGMRPEGMPPSHMGGGMMSGDKAHGDQHEGKGHMGGMPMVMPPDGK